uniref:Uncharacterized protein n=1 Tax=Arundo donax TaxID=35708 RepID=A0A0A9ELE9_ARUDO
MPRVHPERFVSLLFVQILILTKQNKTGEIV